MRKGLAAVVLFGALAGVGGVLASAEERAPADERVPPADEAPDAEREPPAERDSPKPPAKRISLEDATDIVRQAYGGRIVSATAAEARPSPNRPRESGFRIRVDVDGRVKTVFVDGRGRIHERAEF